MPSQGKEVCVCVRACPQLFQRLDPAKSGSVQLSQIKRYFRGNGHPDVAAAAERRRTADEVEAELIELFQVKKSPVHYGQTAQLISWAVSEGGEEGGKGRGGEGRGRRGKGRRGKRGGEGEDRAMGACSAVSSLPCVLCASSCRSLKTTLKDRASNFLLKSTSLLWSRLVGPFDRTSLS